MRLHHKFFPPTLAALEQHIKEELNGNQYGLHFQKQQIHALLIWGGYKNRLPSSALHCNSVLVTVIDHLATSIITPKGLKGHLRLLEDELAPFFFIEECDTVMPYMVIINV